MLPVLVGQVLEHGPAATASRWNQPASLGPGGARQFVRTLADPVPTLLFASPDRFVGSLGIRLRGPLTLSART
jgi:hypothetical protein